MNTIKALFTPGSHKVKTQPLWQYDYGQTLKIEGIALPEAYEVHFSNNQYGTATTMIGYASGVQIPDVYLQNGDVYAWLYLHTGENDGETVYEIFIPINRRASISDQPPTPVQQDVITQTIAALNAGVSEVEGIAEAMPGEIQEALQEAKDSGEFDGFSPTATVSKSGDTATISITDKEGTTTATVKDGAKGDPGTPGQDGKDGKDGADGKDGQDGFSPIASVSKSGKKTTISITDKNGTTTAEVNDGENGADGQDGFSPSASVSKAGSTATISITDKNGTTTAQIPDGQDGATGATPVISIGTVSTLTPGSSATASMDTTDPEHPVLSMGIPEGQPGEVTEAELTAVAESKADIIIDTASGAIASFPDGADNLPMALTVGIEPVQSGSGDPSPSNVRPISGWTGANVSRTGFNQWDEQWEEGIINVDTGLNHVQSNRIRSKNYIPCLPNTSYYWYAGSNYGSLRIHYYDASKNYLGASVYVSGSWNTSYTTPANAYFMRWAQVLADITAYRNDICINISNASLNGTYEPYRGETYPISFPSEAGTVYGGTLTVNKDGTGKLVVDRIEADGTDFGRIGLSSQTETVDVYQEGLSLDGYLSVVNGQIISNRFSTSIGTGIPGRMVLSAQNMYFIIAKSELGEGTSQEKVHQWFIDHPTQFVMKLTTPVSYNLSSLEVIETLKGINNVWADTGNTTADYPCDTKLYISKELSASQKLLELIVTANREDSMKATKAYTTGNLIIVNGTLYRATTSIANGANLTVGTNVTATTIATELANLA